MLKPIVKLFGILALALSVITAILDITRTIANSALTITPLGKEWFDFHVPSLNGFQVGVQRKLGMPWLWDFLIVPVLQAPSWLVFAVFAILFLWLGRRRERRWRQRFGD